MNAGKAVCGFCGCSSFLLTLDSAISHGGPVSPLLAG
jgi:hypothetical protein